jgi:hypothetical protein
MTDDSANSEFGILKLGGAKVDDTRDPFCGIDNCDLSPKKVFPLTFQLKLKMRCKNDKLPSPLLSDTVLHFYARFSSGSMVGS